MMCLLRKPILLAVLAVLLGTTGGLLVRGWAGPEGAAALPTEETPPSNGVIPANEVATQGDPAKNAPERRQLLQTIGVLTAANYTETYFNLGLIADSKAKGTYTDGDARKLLGTMLALLSSVEQNLNALGKTDLDKEDRESLGHLLVLSSLLRQQSQDLQKFWDSGREEDRAHYESAAKDSWAAIGRLTGIGR